MDEKDARRLLDFVNALLDDPEHAELDVSALGEDARELGERLAFLGSCVQEGRVFAEDLARGDLGAITSTYSSGSNPLIPSLDAVRRSLAQFLDLGQNLASADTSARLDPKSDYAQALNSMIDDIHRRHTELERSAYTDPLTGVGNRRAYERAMDDMWERGLPFTIAFIDIDNLKRCNDQYGHAAGNQYILQTSLHLKLRRKENEAVYRIGGDEFVYVSASDSEEGLAARLGQCREQLIGYSHQAAPCTFSFSYGCSRVDPIAGDSRQQMVTDADRKMYRYKLLHRADVQNAGEDGRTSSVDLDERIFEALAMTSEGRYYYVCDIDHDESYWSNNAVRDFGLPSSHMHGAGNIWVEHIHPDDRAAYVSEVERLFAGKLYRHSMQYRAKNASGDYVICECRGFRLDAEGEKPALFVGTITNRSLAESIDPATGLGDIHGLISAIGTARHVQRPTGLIGVKVNRLAQINAIHGYEAGDELLANIANRLATTARGSMTPFRSRGAQFALIGMDLSSEDVWRLSCQMKDALCEPIALGDASLNVEADVAWVHYNEVTSQPFAILSDLSRRIRAVVSRNVPELVCGEKGARNPLTGLHGGNDFLARASQLNCNVGQGLRCLISLDLGNLRLFNEWFGHQTGDALLADVGHVLAALEDEGTAAAGYWGQDDFCLYTRFDRVLIDDIFGRVSRAVGAYNDSPGFQPSFGVLPLDPHRKVTIDDYSKALFTNRNARQDFRNRISFFEPLRYEEKSQEHQLLSGFQYAISDGEIFFVMQPQVDIRTGRTVGAEALVRWTRKDGTKLAPAQFIPVLERNGFIVTLDKHIWSLVAKWMHDAIGRGVAPVPVSINVSRVDVLTFDVPEFIGGLLATYNLPAGLLEAEVTETAYMQDQEAISRVVNRLRAMGVRVLMDDFGTGRSSLSMLGGVTVDVIKLDRQFLPTSDDTQARIGRDESIVTSMVLMARSLDLPMIVEGVETEEQATLIRDLGARYVQGFWSHRPMSSQDFETLLSDADSVDYDGILRPSERTDEDDKDR